MRWSSIRSWWVLAGSVLFIAGLTAVPAIVKSAHLPGPPWLIPAITKVAGVLLAAVKPLLATRTDTLNARAKKREERESRAADALDALPGRADRRVRDVADRAVLNIHEAIPLPVGSAGEGLSADLPEYVARDIDADLRSFLTGKSSTGGFALLLGPAAAGKTRCAYEAIRAVLPGWRLLMPATGAEINALVADGADLTRSVIWLNETQNFLTVADPLTAATVRRLLTDTARPVILIGTMWHDVHEQLRAVETQAVPPRAARPDDPANPAEPLDSGRNSREVLDQARVFGLPRFSTAEWARVDDLTARDPRLAQAAAHRDSGLGLTQLLSAVPELLRRWEHADNPYGQALLTAAVTARRCGHPDTLPDNVLRPLTDHFLTGAQRARATETWYADALTWAVQPVHHSTGISCLRPHAAAIGHLDGHRVSDILTDHSGGPDALPPETIPSRVWEIVTEAATPQACLRIGTAARRAGRTPQTRAAWLRSAGGGLSVGMFCLGQLAKEEGDTLAADLWWSRAADLGEVLSMVNLGLLREEAGRFEEALATYDRAVETDPTNSRALSGRGSVLGKLKRFGDAVRDLDRALELKPDFAWAIEVRGYLHGCTGRYRKALEDFDRALAITPRNVWTLVSRGVTKQHLEQYTEALSDFDRALALDPESVFALSSRAGVLRLLDQWEKAILDHDHALAQQPDRESDLINRSTLYRMTGQYEQALDNINRAIDPQSDVAANNLASRGLLHRIMGNHECAVADLTRAVELAPENPWGRYEAGVALLATGDPGSQGHLREAVRIIESMDPGSQNSAVYAGNLVLSRSALGEWEEADRALDAFLRLDPPPGQAHELSVAIGTLARVTGPAAGRPEALRGRLAERLGRAC